MQQTAHPPYHDPLNWLVRDRQSGRITVAQWPNAPLAIFLAATALKVVLHPRGTAGLIVGVIATISIVIWALLEIIRGVNPFRRILGGVVLVSQLSPLLTH